MNLLNTTAARLCALRTLVLVAGLSVASVASAQFTMVPSPQCKAPGESAKEGEREYRVDAARHLYTCFPMRIFRGKLPPLLHGVMMVEVELDAQGNVLNVGVVRKPAAAVVEPWIMALIQRAAPYPAPVKLPGGTVRFTETFFVDKSGLFQTHSLTEGQL